jgi:RND family efflux transporter MFP subunit
MPKLLFVPIPILFLAGCGEPARESKHPPTAAPLPVETVAAAREDWPRTYEATGTVYARASAIVSAKLMAYVREVKVQTGDRVRARQSLIVLDSRDADIGQRKAQAATDEVRQAIQEADSGVAAARAALDLEQATFRRMGALYATKSISDHEFDEASARLKSAQAAYEMARSRRGGLDARLAQAAEEGRAAELVRGYSEISAPFAGIVTAKSVDPGTLATPGAPLLTVEREGGYRLEASVEESRLAAIRAGQTVTVTLDGVDRPIEARVSEIVPTIDAASRTGIVRIDLPALATIRSGLFGRASFSQGMKTVTSVPMGAVVENGQLQSVFVADGAVARLRLVTTGQKSKDRIEILSGLGPGEPVVFPVPPGISDGAPIRIGARP